MKIGRGVRSVLVGLGIVWLLSVQTLASESPDPLDWPHWRGPEQNGVSRETGLIDRFDPRGGAGSNVLWKNAEAGGISTPIVMRGKLYTIVRDQPRTPRDGEKVLCLDAATGTKLWEKRYNVFLSDVPGERIGWSNLEGDPQAGRIYVLGACCLFACLDAETGHTIWARSLSEEYGMLSTYGGRTSTPVVFEDLVIISGVTTGWGESARPAHRILALDKNDGRLVWISSTQPLPEDTTYSTPQVTVLNGQAAIVFGAGDGSVYAMQPRTGTIIWRYQLSRRGVNVSPIVANDTVYIGHSEENIVGTSMGAVVAIDGRKTGDVTKSGELWRTEDVTEGKSSPLLVDGRLYVIDDSAGLHIFDARSGQQLGTTMKLGTAMRGSPLWADGKIYACTAGGVFHVLQIRDNGVKTLFRTRLPSGEQCGGSPIASHGRIYLPTTGALYCLGSEDPQPGATATTEPSAGSATGVAKAARLQTNGHDHADAPEPSAGSATGAAEAARLQTNGHDHADALEPSAGSATGEDPRVASIQLVPAEALLQPGQALQYEVRVYNARGQRQPPPADTVQFTVAGGGIIDAQGKFQAPAGGEHTAAIVTAKIGDLSAQARVRSIPPLPWRFDFSDGQLPSTWIGARYRHEPRTVDGEPLIVKITTIPKGTRSQSWMGMVDLCDYTIEADLKAVGAEDKLPDMGVIAQRYTLDIMGESQQLQIRTWPPQLRMAQTIPFAWRPGIWYRVKLRASVEDGKAVLRGKVWPREDAEPDTWTITASDDVPNEVGSPGLYGNATNAEIFIDNVAVTPNTP